jgi:hypothetical protein
MKRIAIAMGLLLLVADGAVMAQNGRSNANSDRQTTVQAPVGHRQPRVGEVPDEKNLSNPTDQANKEDAELDRKIKSICRGC